MALVIASTRWFIALINLITAQPKPAKTAPQPNQVSVLIPARNEAHTLPILLQNLQKTGSLISEIIVYNDQSEDETADIVRQRSHHDTRIRLIEGHSLPEGWVGKNNACHQLAMAARAKYLLFLDADVKTDHNAIELAVAQMQKKKLTLFSFFPSQQMQSFGEWLLVAQVNVILTSLLPLALINHLPFQIMAAANGQFMMFDADIYHQYRFHEKVRGTPVEDVAIARNIKKSALKMRTALAPAQLTCRMYQGYRDALCGLARSARYFFGGSIIAGWIYAIFSLLGWISVLTSMHPLWLAGYFLLLISMRAFVARASHQSVAKNLLLMPLQQLALLHLLYTASKQTLTKKTIWKGRKI